MTIIDSIKKAENILIIGHSKPDGDCLGSGFSLYRLALKFNKKVNFACDSEKPAHFSFFKYFDMLNIIDIEKFDLLITVDCADNLRMGKYQSYLNSVKNSINIDHHITNNKFAAENIVNPSACSTCEIIYGLIKPYDVIDSDIAVFLFTGISTDTGHFMHSNTTSLTFQIASDLVNLGANTNLISRAVYKQNTIAKIKLVACAIESMRFFKEDRICVITVLQSDFDKTGCTLADTEGLIDHAMSIGCVEVAVCIAQQNKSLYKVSFRSKGADVSQSAGIFGGGGHKQASGCVVSGYYEDVVRKVVKSVNDVMAD